MTLNNFRQRYHQMITDKVIAIPSTDTIINRKEKKCYSFHKVAMILYVILLVLFSVIRNDFSYGYHHFSTDHVNIDVYGGADHRVLGVNKNQLYYATGKYDGNEFVSIIITEVSLKSGKQNNIIEIESNNVVMLNNNLIYLENDKTIVIFDVERKVERIIKFDYQINDIKMISEKLIVVCSNGNSLIYVFDDLDKPSSKYQLNIVIDNVVYFDNERLLYTSSEQLRLYDLFRDQQLFISAELSKLVDGHIDKIIIHNDQLIFSSDNLNGSVYKYDLNTSALSVITDTFNNRLITSLIIYENDLLVTVFDGDSSIYRLSFTGRLKHIKTIEDDRIWSIIFDNENYLIELDDGYFLDTIN